MYVHIILSSALNAFIFLVFYVGEIVHLTASYTYDMIILNHHWVHHQPLARLYVVNIFSLPDLKPLNILMNFIQNK